MKTYGYVCCKSYCIQRTAVVSLLILSEIIWNSRSFLPTPTHRDRHVHIQPTSPLSASSIQWCPSCIEFDQVSLQYPESLWRKLTSSVPRREYALSNITCSFSQKDGIVLLVGASSSGKSTILKITEGTETPTDGAVRIVARDHDKVAPEFVAKPILLDDRSPLSRPQNTVEEELTATLQRIQQQPASPSIDSLLDEVLTVVDVPKETVLSDLSPSQYYKFRLAQGVVESSCGCSSNKSFSPTGSEDRICLPSPILLLDEWMDTETSQVVTKVVNPALQNIVYKLGGIVICVTHKPHLFDAGKSGGTLDGCGITKVTLSAGKVLSVETFS